MIGRILAEGEALIYLLASLLCRCKYVFTIYLFGYLHAKMPFYHFSKILLFSLILLHSFLNISLAYNEVCSFESYQSCGLYDCKGNSWYIDNSVGYPQSPSLHSGVIQNGGESSLCRNITGPATITFWWRADGINSRLGELFFLVDGLKKYVCTSTEWVNSSYTIRDNGNHTISWIYRKMRSYPEYLGGGWIDNLSIDYQNNWLPQVISDLNASVSPLDRTGNPILVTVNPALLTINTNSIFMNSSIVRLNTTKMLTDSFSIVTNVSKLEINSSNMSMNVNGNIKIPKISKVSVDKILGTNGNISPQIELLLPKSNTDFEINESVSFKYLLHPSGNNFINKCSLCLNENEITWDSNVNYDDERVYSFNHALNRNLLGTNKWRIRCYDNFSRMYESSEYRSINVYLNSSIINVTNETDLYKCNFSSINEALCHASPQSTIVVYKKTNNEHVIINKPITLIGISNSTIYNEGYEPEIILINGSNVSIKGFCLKAKRTQQTISILNNNLSDIAIYNNNISEGFNAKGVKNITVADNTIAHDTIRNAIHLEECSEISLINNVITGPNNNINGVGVYLGNCNLADKIKFIKNNISNVVIGVEICATNYNDDSFIQGLKLDNNISNINRLQEYDVRITCD